MQHNMMLMILSTWTPRDFRVARYLREIPYNLWINSTRAEREKERKRGSNTRAELKVHEQVRKREAPTGPLSSPSLPPQGPDSCPVFIATLCSSPAARPLTHTSHHNVSFFLFPGPARVIDPLYDHHWDTSSSGPWARDRW